jgi:two-component system, cell cycle sensor histidine kinase and response regulator CckA
VAKHVLYVDDDPDMSFLSEVHLTDGGYRVTCVPHGRAALETLKTVSADVVVADFQMPGHTGPELAELVAQAVPGLPVVLTSAFVNEDRKQEARAAGALALVEKAADSAPLLDCLAKLFPK